MALAALLLLFAAQAGSLGAAERAAVTPVEKVIQLLDDMLAKGQAAKHEEEVGFAKFQEWCEGIKAEKTKSIGEASSQIEQLQADILKAESDAEVLGQEIAVLEGTMTKDKAEAEEATDMRKKENADYITEEADLSESIAACAKAIAVLKARSSDVPQSLQQVRSAPRVPDRVKAAIQAFLQAHARGDWGAEAGAELLGPEANAYEFQSGGVVALLEDLEGKFKAELLALQKAEMTAKGNYQLVMQQLTDNLEQDSKIIAAKTSSKASKMEDAAVAKGELNITEKAKAEDETALADTLAECHSKSEEFEKNQVTRAEEMKAIIKATEILKSSAVSGNAEKYMPAVLIQAKKSASLAQARSVLYKDRHVQERAAAYLQARSKVLGSRYLSVMAAHTLDDPFVKVKKMIKDLITKLMEEANTEADEHAYCTSELATNKQTRDNKGAEVDELAAKSEKLTAEAAKLADEIQQLSDAIAEMQGQRADASQLRQAEKAENTKAVADAKEAQTAVQQAVEVLRSFYAKEEEEATGGASLLQGKARAAHRSSHRSAEPYKGMDGSSSGVLAMLEVILSDFARLESEVSASEDHAQSSYEKFMDETAEDIAVKTTEVRHKEGMKQRAAEQLRITQKQLELTQQELTEALDYYDKLKADCVDTGLSYDERKKQRQEEIKSLQEALKILSGEDIA